MKGKRNQDMTLDELKAKAKTLRAVMWVVNSLILLYAAYFVYSLIQGTWEANNTLGIFGMGVLVVLVSTLSAQISAVAQEMKNRK